MIDAHCHLFEAKDVSTEVQRFRDIGGTAMLCCGSNLETSQKSVKLAKIYPEIFAAVGIHPEGTLNYQIPNSNEFIKLTNHKKVIAIGECGLDYYPDTTAEQKDFQQNLLKFNIALAKETNLPLVVHCRNAFDDLFKILDYPKVQTHCFTGNLAQMQECIKRGWYISFGGILTFKSGKILREVAALAPNEKLLIETDSPYLTPEPLRGNTNEPKNVKIVAEKLAEVRKSTLAEIETVTTENFRRLFL